MDVRCTQCGAAVEVAADVRLLECPYCTTALVVDGSATLFHEIMQPTVANQEVAAHLRRFLAGGATVANLDKNARIGQPKLEFFPFWAFTIKAEGGEQVLLQPAAPSSLQGLQGLGLPAGDSRPATPETTGGAPVVDAEVPLSTAREWLKNKKGEVEIRRTVLYHLPLYNISYQYKGQVYKAAVDGVSGKVYPANFPAKAETPYVMVAAMALVVFGIEGLIFDNLLLKILVYLVTVPPMMAVAWLTSKKV